MVAQAEGNPLYAEELVAQGPMSRGSLPSTLRELLLVRIRGLGEEARRVLALAATAGRPVPQAFLAAAWEGQSADLDRGLREALGRGVLIQEPAPSRIAFRHALFGAAVEEDLLPGERIDLHARLAALLVERPELAASTEAGAAAEIAGHWYAAERYPEALEAAVRAAEAAERVPAYAEAHRPLRAGPRAVAAGRSRRGDPAPRPGHAPRACCRGSHEQRCPNPRRGAAARGYRRGGRRRRPVACG